MSGDSTQTKRKLRSSPKKQSTAKTYVNKSRFVAIQSENLVLKLSIWLLGNTGTEL